MPPLFAIPWTDLLTSMKVVPGDNLHASFFSVRREQDFVESGISLDVVHKFDQLGHGDTRCFGTAMKYVKLILCNVESEQSQRLKIRIELKIRVLEWLLRIGFSL